MAPMAIPTFSGMTVAVMTVFVVPVFHCWVKELRSGSRCCHLASQDQPVFVFEEFHPTHS